MSQNHLTECLVFYFLAIVKFRCCSLFIIVYCVSKIRSLCVIECDLILSCCDLYIFCFSIYCISVNCFCSR